jgi:ATP-dependent Clp protease ATP-binding subunit ClpA
MTLDFTEHARRQLFAACTADLKNGGRGIGNQLESNLINPLARFLFDEDVESGSRVIVTELYPGDSDAAPSLDAEISPGAFR